MHPGRRRSGGGQKCEYISCGLRVSLKVAKSHRCQGLLGLARYNVIECTRSIRGPFEQGLSEAANQRGDKITKQTQFRTTKKESMVYGWFPVRRNSRIDPWARSADLTLFQRPRPWARSAGLALFQCPRPWAATEKQNDQTKPILHNVVYFQILTEIDLAVCRILRPSGGEKCGLATFRRKIRVARGAGTVTNFAPSKNQQLTGAFGREIG